jgi:hypothetical protein
MSIRGRPFVVPVESAERPRPTERRSPMKFMLLIYGDEKAAAQASPEQVQATSDAYEEFTKSIVASGNFLDGDPFQATDTASTVEVRDGKTETNKGPADTTSLQLGAYYKVQADSAEQAAEMASRIPGARFGTIEVRPVWEFD